MMITRIDEKKQASKQATEARSGKFMVRRVLAGWWVDEKDPPPMMMMMIVALGTDFAVLLRLHVGDPEMSLERSKFYNFIGSFKGLNRNVRVRSSDCRSVPQIWPTFHKIKAKYTLKFHGFSYKLWSHVRKNDVEQKCVEC